MSDMSQEQPGSSQPASSQPAIDLTAGMSQPANVPTVCASSQPALAGMLSWGPSVGNAAPPVVVPVAGKATAGLAAYPAVIPAAGAPTQPAYRSAAGVHAQPSNIPSAGAQSQPANIPAAGAHTQPETIPAAGAPTQPALEQPGGPVALETVQAAGVPVISVPQISVSDLPAPQASGDTAVGSSTSSTPVAHTASKVTVSLADQSADIDEQIGATPIKGVIEYFATNPVEHESTRRQYINPSTGNVGHVLYSAC